MHTLKVIGAVVGCLWAYAFIGTYVVRQALPEEYDMLSDAGVFLALLGWPLVPIISFFKEN
jgi:hypothetical protein